MGIVMISCPETQRAIPTGMQADYETFHSTPVFFGHTFCPLCRVTHECLPRMPGFATPHLRIATLVVSGGHNTGQNWNSLDSRLCIVFLEPAARACRP